MKFKRFLSGLLAVTAAAAMLGSCGSDDSSSEKGGKVAGAGDSKSDTASSAESEASATSVADESAAEDAASSEEEPAADPANEGDPNDYKFEEIDDGVEKYGRAGIIWMNMDQWDHRKDLDLCATDEDEAAIVPSTNTDVYITGNGTYTVEMSGYHAPQDWLDAGIMCGYLGVEVILDIPSYPDFTFWIDECVIDGQKYTFEHGENEDGEPLQVIEDTEAYEDDRKMIKIKNGYGDGLIEDASCWKTADTMTVTFTIGGLPTDKLEDYENEKINVVYGSGSVD